MVRSNRDDEDRVDLPIKIELAGDQPCAPQSDVYFSKVCL